VAEQLPGCDEVVVYDKRGTDGGIRGLLRAGSRLREFGPDLALVPHTSVRSGALAWLSGAPRRVGHPPLFCTERIPLDRSLTFVDRILALSTRAGAASQGDGLELGTPPDPGGHAQRLLGKAPPPVVGLVPGAEWATKRWPAARYARLAKMWTDRGATVVLLGGPAERELAAEIQAMAGVELLDSVGNTIEEALAILVRCDLVIGGDSGLVHCARALRRPVVALFGPTDPGRHRFAASERPVQLGIECQPCHDHGPKVCPLGHHRCLAELDEERVLELGLGLLDAGGSVTLRSPP
jgi:heptosyltransferase-2